MSWESGFRAKYPAECVRCDKGIIPGQRVVYIGHTRRSQRLCHKGCAPGQDDE